MRKLERVAMLSKASIPGSGTLDRANQADLNKVLLQVENSMVRKDNELGRMRQSFSALKSAHQDLKQRHASLQSEYALTISKFTDDLCDLKSGHERQLSEVEIARAAECERANSMSDRCDSLTQQLSRMQSEVLSLETKVKSSEDTISVQTSKIDELTLQIETSRSRETSLETRNRQLSSLLEFSLEREEAHAIKLREMESELIMSREAHNLVSKSYSQLQTEFAKLTADLELAVERRLEKASGDAQKWKQLYEKSMDEYTILQRNCEKGTEKLREDHELAIACLKTQSDADTAFLRQQVECTNNELIRLKPLEEKIAEKHSLLALKENVIRDLSDQLSVLKSKRREDDVEKLKTERESLLTEIERLNEMIAEKETIIQYASVELEKIKNEFEEKQSNNSKNFKEQLREAVEAIRIIESQLDAQICENESLKAQLSLLELEKENLSNLNRQRLHKLSAVVAALED